MKISELMLKLEVALHKYGNCDVKIYPAMFVCDVAGEAVLEDLKTGKEYILLGEVACGLIEDRQSKDAEQETTELLTRIAQKKEGA